MSGVQSGASEQLATERTNVNRALRAMIGDIRGGVVAEAMRYATLGGGQRLRPILALRTGRMLGGPMQVFTRAALSVELIHSASLIVDDLPCMDDDDARRGRPSVHKAFGEATAILAAFGLVALAARSLTDGGFKRREMDALVQFQRRLLGMLDCSTLIAGQALDLGLRGAEDIDPAMATALKTAPLFELALHAGMVAAGCREDEAEELARFGFDFGLAFQLADDYLDGELQNRAPVVAQLKQARQRLRRFGPKARTLNEIVDYLDERICSNAGSDIPGETKVPAGAWAA